MEILRTEAESGRPYSRSGVREYWIVGPRERDVILLVLDGGRFRETTLGVRDTLESSVLQGFRIAVREIFDGLER